MELAECRVQIDALDRQIIELIEKRMDVAAEIGLEKKRLGRPIFDVVREQEKLKKVRELTANDSIKDRMEKIYQSIMDETKVYEQEIIDNEDR